MTLKPQSHLSAHIIEGKTNEILGTNEKFEEIISFDLIFCAFGLLLQCCLQSLRGNILVWGVLNHRVPELVQLYIGDVQIFNTLLYTTEDPCGFSDEIPYL